jgi:hypothetical protein
MFWSMTPQRATAFSLKICWMRQHKEMTGAICPYLFLIVFSIIKNANANIRGYMQKYISAYTE